MGGHRERGDEKNVESGASTGCLMKSGSSRRRGHSAWSLTRPGRLYPLSMGSYSSFFSGVLGQLAPDTQGDCGQRLFCEAGIRISRVS